MLSPSAIEKKPSENFFAPAPSLRRPITSIATPSGITIHSPQPISFLGSNHQVTKTLTCAKRQPPKSICFSSASSRNTNNALPKAGAKLVELR